MKVFVFTYNDGNKITIYHKEMVDDFMVSLIENGIEFSFNIERV